METWKNHRCQAVHGRLRSLAAVIVSDSGVVMSITGIRHVGRDKAEYKSIAHNDFPR